MNKIYKKKSGDERTTQNGLSIAFLLYMGILYPLIMHDKYFDITLTKYKAFEVALCIYAVLMALAVLLDIFDGRRPFDMFKSKNGYIAADLFMAGFLVSNLAAFALSEDKLDAYTGEAGRRCGLQFAILIVILYICMGRGLKLEKFVLPAFLAAGSFTGIIAVFQYIGVDFLGIREGLSSSIKDIYISTFGNIDIFASFICVVIPVALGLGLDERPIYDGDVVWKLNWTKLLSWVALFIGAAAVVVTNANLAYAGVGAAVVVVFLVAAYGGKLKEFLEMMFAMSLGSLTVSLMIRTSQESVEKLDGISEFARHTGSVVVVCAVLGLVNLIIQIVTHAGNFRKKKSDGHAAENQGKKTEKISGKLYGKPALIAASSLVAAGVIGAIVYASLKAGHVFKIDDSWGNYRGYVWKRLAESYRDFPLINKIFGYGNESVKTIMIDGYYDEMMNTVGVVYDNAHNEYLQYLVTTGIVGAVAYIGLIVSAFVSMIRCAFGGAYRDLCECTAIALGIAGYTTQALFNLNQSLTTPYIFLLAAMAAGICRKRRMQKQGMQMRNSK